MANSKLIPVALLVVLTAATVNAGMIDLINALTPGSTDKQDMNMLDPLPQKVQDKIPQEIKDKLKDLKVSDVKKELKAGKDALKQCVMQMKSPKDCLKDLKAVMPKLSGLAKAVKKQMMKMMNKLYTMIQNIIPQLKSQLLKNILQTVLNMMPMPPARRRKRSVIAMEPQGAPGSVLFRRKRQINISIKIQIKSLMQSPMSMQQVIQMLKQIKDAVLKAVNGSPSILQQIINLLSSMSPMIAKLFSNPAVTKALGTQPPPSS